jgi:hypothetical protein
MKEDAVRDNPPHVERRYEKTLRFLTASLPPPARLLDLGAPNPLSRRMEQAGYTVHNTDGDLDATPEAVRALVRDYDAEAVTAFEILEHLTGPINVLRALGAPRLFATVPLRLWFASAYRNPNDPWDRHFHEFEDWQFDWLLEHAGWQILRREKWTGPTRTPGFRMVLRWITPRYYAVEAVRR